MRTRIAFCGRCRGMKTDWNKRYVLHCLLCKRWLQKSSKLASLAVLAAGLLLAFPESSESVPAGDAFEQSSLPASYEPSAISISPAVRTMDAFLTRHQVRETNRMRLAESIVASARKHNVDAKLIASITIVESRGNPHAISGKSAVGIMQIHLPTWGRTADREGINLFKIEDNIDFGTRILKNYVHQYGLWEGVKRYNGFVRSNPASEQSADAYVAKVQQIYGVAAGEPVNEETGISLTD